jgi:hypothetical protein
MTNDTNVSELAVADIKVDPECQARAASNDATINEYAKIMKEGNDNAFPPVVVFHDGTDYWLSDGFHRHSAAQKAGLLSLKMKIHQGPRRDAVLYAVGANVAHGLRRTNADKRRAVNILLEDEEWSTWSNRDISRRCGVDEGLVRKLRSVSADNPQIARKVERKGTRYQMKTDKIGKIDERAEQSPLQPYPNDQPEQVWDHTRQPVETDANASELSDHEPVSSSEQPCSSDEAQLQELMCAWYRASADVRQEFLVSIGLSLNAQFEADHPGVAEAASSIEPTASPVSEPSATELPQSNRLFELWKGLKPNTRANGLKWLADNCPSVYRDSHFMITESLVSFRQAAREAIPQELAEFLELARTYQVDHQYS